MAQKIKIFIIQMITIVMFTSIALACAGAGDVVSSKEFQEGFREGWNSTAPEEYRY